MLAAGFAVPFVGNDVDVGELRAIFEEALYTTTHIFSVGGQERDLAVTQSFERFQQICHLKNIKIVFTGSWLQITQSFLENVQQDGKEAQICTNVFVAGYLTAVNLLTQWGETESQQLPDSMKVIEYALDCFDFSVDLLQRGQKPMSVAEFSEQLHENCDPIPGRSL